MSTIQILPVTFEVEGCEVTLLELLKSRLPDGTVWYHAVCMVKCGNIESKTFCIDARSNEELKAKLLTEITKLKLMRLLYGDEFARRVVG